MGISCKPQAPKRTSTNTPPSLERGRSVEPPSVATACYIKQVMQGPSLDLVFIGKDRVQLQGGEVKEEKRKGHCDHGPLCDPAIRVRLSRLTCKSFMDDDK